MREPLGGPRSSLHPTLRSCSPSVSSLSRSPRSSASCSLASSSSARTRATSSWASWPSRSSRHLWSRGRAPARTPWRRRSSGGRGWTRDPGSAGLAAVSSTRSRPGSHSPRRGSRSWVWRCYWSASALGTRSIGGWLRPSSSAWNSTPRAGLSGTRGTSHGRTGPRQPFGRFVERTTGSVFSFFGRGLRGPLEGVRLRGVPQSTAFWFAWSEFYPRTTLARLPENLVPPATP